MAPVLTLSQKAKIMSSKEKGGETEPAIDFACNTCNRHPNWVTRPISLFLTDMSTKIDIDYNREDILPLNK